MATICGCTIDGVSPRAATGFNFDFSSKAVAVVDRDVNVQALLQLFPLLGRRPSLTGHAGEVRSNLRASMI